MNKQRIILDISGMTCAHCARTIGNLIEGPGLLDKQIDYKSGEAIVEYDAEMLSINDLIEKINDSGTYRVTGVKG